MNDDTRLNEYFRRNNLVAASIGVKTSIENALRDLPKRSPKWLVKRLKFALETAEKLPKELATYRDSINCRTTFTEPRRDDNP